MPNTLSATAALIGRRQLLRRQTYVAGSEADPPSLARGAHASYGEAGYWLRVHRRAMACRFEVTLGGEDARHIAAARAALDEVDAIESQLTVFRESSALVELNRTAADRPVRVDDDLFRLLCLCRRLHVETERAFDITSTPLSRCWGFLRRDGRLPHDAEIARALAMVGMRHVIADATARTIQFDRTGVELNLGAIGKGWALDRIAARLTAEGVGSALLSAGRSSIRAVGVRGGGWRIDLTSPRVASPLARVTLRYGALGSSGAGEQFFEVDGKRYGHVIDPRTGWPAEGVLSVSVMASDAAVADALSTAFFVGGAELAHRYCDANPLVLVVLTRDDDRRRPMLIGEYPGAEVDIA